MPAKRAKAYEPSNEVESIKNAFASQWAPINSETPKENYIDRTYIGTADRTIQGLTLKQAIFLALEHNPNVKVAELSPLAATEGVAIQNAIFDPDLTSTADTIKTVIPATTAFETRGGSTALSTKQYDWNFAVNKILAQTNGTLSLTFTNDRTITNNATETINPYYIPTLALSLSQPLLRNFGWKFATINVRLAQAQQQQAQWNYVGALDQIVQQVGNDYWNVVLAEENLQVAQAALKFNADLVRQNGISVKVGTLAPLDLQEAQSAAATAEANLYTAQANLKIARATLRQDVMLNPSGAFLPQEIEPVEKPGTSPAVILDEGHALERAVEFRPSLAALRAAIRTSIIETRFQDNQVLPQVNAQMQFATTTQVGNTLCGSTFGVIAPNCFAPGPGSTPGKDNGYQLPFSGTYGSGLNNMFNFKYYNYAVVFTFERPLANASANAALAQSRIDLEQAHQQYRASLSQAVVQVQSAIAAVTADIERVKATTSATFYARESLHDEEIRFRVGMATTHDLLQFQEEEISAEGNEVQARIDLENAKLAYLHSTGTLLRSFQIEFELAHPASTPWYAHM
ncbi:MAG TPA: TolC family protein [Candidatus Binataceae bacterium]|nr:TolC family protein [Candidatus Binataceae bacterium]